MPGRHAGTVLLSQSELLTCSLGVRADRRAGTWQQFSRPDGVCCAAAHGRSALMGVTGGADAGGVVEVTVHAGPEPPSAAGEAAEAEALVPAAAAPRRLWLHGSLASSPGAFGFFRTAKGEPLGDNLRLLLNYDPPGAVPPVTGVPQPLSGARTLLEALPAGDRVRGRMQGPLTRRAYGGASCGMRSTCPEPLPLCCYQDSWCRVLCARS